MLRIGAIAKMVQGTPGIAVTFGEKGRTLHTCELPLYEFDALVAAMVRQRDDAHAFFRRAGVFVGPSEPPAPPKKRYSPPRIRAVPPTDPRTEVFLDGLPTPMLPPPLEEEKKS